MAPPIVIVTASTAPGTTGRPQVRLNEAYTRALEAVGLLPLIVGPMAPDAVPRALDVAAGLVLTGGEDVAPELYGASRHPTVTDVHAARDASEVALARAARDRRLPTFAICRGLQVMNVALGGTLVQDLPSANPSGLPHSPGGAREARVHPIGLTARSRLASIVGGEVATVNSLHHQAIERAGEGLAATAVAPDGTIEAAESTDASWWMVGVQWHPEELTATPEPWDAALFRAFADAVRSGADA